MDLIPNNYKNNIFAYIPTPVNSNSGNSGDMLKLPVAKSKTNERFDYYKFYDRIEKTVYPDKDATFESIWNMSELPVDSTDVGNISNNRRVLALNETKLRTIYISYTGLPQPYDNLYNTTDSDNVPICPAFWDNCTNVKPSDAVSRDTAAKVVFSYQILVQIQVIDHLHLSRNRMILTSADVKNCVKHVLIYQKCKGLPSCCLLIVHHLRCFRLYLLNLVQVLVQVLGQVLNRSCSPVLVLALVVDPDVLLVHFHRVLWFASIESSRWSIKT